MDSQLLEIYAQVEGNSEKLLNQISGIASESSSKSEYMLWLLQKNRLIEMTPLGNHKHAFD